MSNINNLNAVSFLSVEDRKQAQALINAATNSSSSSRSSQQQSQQDRAETASIASYSSSSALLKSSDKSSAKASATSKNLDAKKLQAQGFMSQFRFSN